MDKPDIDPAGKEKNGSDSLRDGSSTLDLDHVKKVMAVKVANRGMHYAGITMLGTGSFGEVHSARDTLLGREVAIKSLKLHFREEQEVVDRFLKEARGTAQLEHPNIMPVHEMGVTEEFGIYFTMKKVEGETLRQILDNLSEHYAFYHKRYPLNLLLEIFLSVCNAVAFAHSRGVIHRDLKPANIMTGEFGEVLVLDWGLVKQMDSKDDSSGKVQLRMEELGDGSQTLDGAVSGTPNYMSPEQAEGRIDDIGVHSDIYSLGAILYHILAHVPAFEKAPIRQLLANVKSGTFQPPRARRPDLKIPRELEAICLKAMSLYPVSRYQSVEQLARDVRNYIGHFEVSAYRAPRLVRYWKACKRNPVKASVAAAACTALLLAFGAQHAMLYGSYKNSVDRADDFRIKGDQAEADARRLYDELRAEGEKTEQRGETDAEKQLRGKLEDKLVEAESHFYVALADYDGVPKQYRAKSSVRSGKIDVMTKRFESALYRRDYGKAVEWLNIARQSIDSMGLRSDREIAGLLASAERRVVGHGSLKVIAPEKTTKVELSPLIDDHGRLKVGDPLRISLAEETRELAKGSYLLTVQSEGLRQLVYPVHLGHEEQKVLELQIPKAIPEGMVYVPGGDFFYGGEQSRFYRQRLRPLPNAFFIKKHEVTFAEYLEFWQSLPDPALKADCISRVQFSHRDRLYVDAWNDKGEVIAPLGPELPVVGITLDAAKAFCEWKSRQAGATIRLPTAEEWEKAARGVDGRTYVWGNGSDEVTKLANIKKTTTLAESPPAFERPGKFKFDTTVYGAYDMAGNVREMTTTPLPGSEVLYQIKGASASTPATFLPCCYASDTPVVPTDVGFRYIQEIPAP